MGKRYDDVPLGPLQSVWDAWVPVQERIMNEKEGYFIDLIGVQIAEVIAASAEKDKAHTAEEIVDIMSICLNWLRSMGHTPGYIAKLIEQRCETRYLGKVNEILDKYHRTWKIG